MVQTLILTFAVIVALPLLTRAIFSLAGSGVHGTSIGINTFVWALFSMGKYLVIPLAALVLIAPDSWAALMPSGSSLFGSLVLAVAALILLLELLKGFGSAILIGFWALMCWIIISTFHVGGSSPQALNVIGPTTSPITLSQPTLGPSVQNQRITILDPPSRLKPTKKKVRADGLEYSQFSSEKKVFRDKYQTKADDGILWQSIEGIKSLGNSVVESLSSPSNFTRSQSIKPLPSEMFYGSSNKKHRYYGFTKGEEKQAAESSTSYISSLLGR